MTSLGTPPSVSAKPPAQRKRDRTCVRDRLLALRGSVPLLTEEDAEFMNRVIREARESSIADPVPA